MCEPFKVMEFGEGENDKWFTKQCKVSWIVFYFGKPIVMRGFGIKCCDNKPDEDDIKAKKNPNHFRLEIQDAIKKNDQSGESNAANQDAKEDDGWEIVNNTIKNTVFTSKY